MPSTEIFNIVMVGEGFPVTTLELTDFPSAGGRWAQNVRLPVLVDAISGPYRILVATERAEFAAIMVEPGSDEIGFVENMALQFVQLYIGPRSVRSVGHNYRAAFTADEFSPDLYLKELLPTGRLEAALGTNRITQGELIWKFTDEGGEVTVRTGTGPDGRVRMDLNYNFVVGDGRPQTLVRRLADSLGRAVALTERFPTSIKAEQKG